MKILFLTLIFALISQLTFAGGNIPFLLMPLQATMTLSSISPTTGPAIGGTSVTITGGNFANGMIIRIGSNLCTSVTVNSATSATCTTPVGGPEWTEVSVESSGYVTVLPAAFIFTCPTNYVAVPGLTDYSEKAFCVAKYEAKQSGSVAISQASGYPWQNSRPNAITACRANGTGFQLISNNEWQTIARNIEGVASNWSTGTVGSGALNRGNSENVQAVYPASSDDNVSCFGMPSGCNLATHHKNRRTHALSNGQIIWDLAGNAWEWNEDDVTTYLGVTTYQSQVTNASHTTLGTDGKNAKAKFGPAGNYTGLNSGEYGGLGRFRAEVSNTATVIRGGCYDCLINAGIFSAETHQPVTQTWPSFRCVLRP